MTRHKRHLGKVSNVPGADYQSPAVRVCLYLPDNIGKLVVNFAVGSFPGSPLLAIYRPQFTVLVCPLVPDAYPIFRKVAYVGFTFYEPQQFMDNTLNVKLLGCNQRKPMLQVETHLVTENAPGSSTSAVSFVNSLVQNMLQKVKILLHKRKV
jgi:hypothetical protein